MCLKHQFHKCLNFNHVQDPFFQHSNISDTFQHQPLVISEYPILNPWHFSNSNHPEVSSQKTLNDFFFCAFLMLRTGENSPGPNWCLLWTWRMMSVELSWILFSLVFGRSCWWGRFLLLLVLVVVPCKKLPFEKIQQNYPSSMMLAALKCRFLWLRPVVSLWHNISLQVDPARLEIWGEIIILPIRGGLLFTEFFVETSYEPLNVLMGW